MDHNTIIVTAGAEQAIHYIRASLDSTRREIIIALQFVLQKLLVAEGRIPPDIHGLPNND
jgi:hypothetical protein